MWLTTCIHRSTTWFASEPQRLVMRTFTVRIVALASGFLAASTAAASPLRSGCQEAPVQALEPALVRPTEVLRGFRITALRWDPLLQQQWAILSSCEHPELPPFTLPVSERGNRHTGATKTSPSIIHTGDVVRVWSQEAFVRIEMTGVAEGNALLGDRVRVHMLRPSTEVSAGTSFVSNVETLSGVARGVHEVEIER
jgi:hypothetical protein